MQGQLKQLEREITQDQIPRFYRILYLPGAEGLQREDMGIPTYGSASLAERALHYIQEGIGQLVQNLDPYFIESHYLKGHDYVTTAQLFNASTTTPGETLTAGPEVWKEAIARGVERGLFGFGFLDEEEQPHCTAIRERVIVNLSPREIILRPALCRPKHPEEKAESPHQERATYAVPATPPPRPQMAEPLTPLRPSTAMRSGREHLRLRFVLPLGRASDLYTLFNTLQQHFQHVELEIIASQGRITETEIENAILEFFDQIGTEPEIE